MEGTMKLHWKQEMQYLNGVADLLIAMGYHVEEPDTKYREWLDVWGTVDGRKCYQEIYVTMYPIVDGGVNKNITGVGGIWHQGENEPVEVHLYEQSYDGKPVIYEVDDIGLILDGLRPFKKGKRKAA
jgi:hypothetical protein